MCALLNFNGTLTRRYNYSPTLQPQMIKAYSLLKELQDVCSLELVDSDDEQEILRTSMN